MENEIQQLKRRMADMESQIAAMNQSSTISFQTDNAFRSRGFLKKIGYEIVDPLTNDNLNTLIPTPDGDVPVLAFPIRWLRLVDAYEGGGNYYIPAYTVINDLP